MRSRDPGSWMWAEALELLQDAERLQRRFFHIGAAQGAPRWEPPVDLYEQGNELTLLIALPGVAAQQLEVVLTQNAVIVRGERSLPANSRRAAIHRLEIPYGQFERRITMPAGKFALVDQRLDQGCLVLTMRRLA